MQTSLLTKPKDNKQKGVLLLAGSAFFLSSCLHPLPPPVKKELPIVDKTIPAADRKKNAAASSQSKIPTKPAFVKIGIRIGIESTLVKCDDTMAVKTAGGHSTRLAAGSYAVKAVKDHLYLDGKRFESPLRLEPTSGEPLKIKDTTFRGAFILRAKGDKVTIINELDIDDYLKGVLPREVVTNWPMESLKAQAVASRTYLASHFGSHGAQGFDLCSDVHCQVYGGLSREHPACSKAVDETRNEILTYNHKPISAYFHSNCGGMTERALAVWGKADEPYLVRKRCSYGTKDPRYNWRTVYTAEDILTLLKKKGLVEGESLLSISIHKRSASSRVETLTVRTDQGLYTIKGNDFRIALDPEKIRSLLWISFSVHGDTYRFEGKGWGHGVGLCQWGAKGQAELRRDYRDILYFYYPGSKLESWRRR